MRILEQCSATWPLPEIQSAIDSLRLAFSADINQPFELKMTFPYGSPSEQHSTSPPAIESQYNQYGQPQMPSPHRLGYKSHSATPPISAGADDSRSDSSQPTNMNMLHPQIGNNMTAPLVDEKSWDPTRIMT